MQAKISIKNLRQWPVNTTCKVEIYKLLCGNPKACFALSGHPYLCEWENRPRFTPQKRKMANRKTNRKETRPKRPAGETRLKLRTRHGSKFSGTAIKVGARTVEMRTQPRAPLQIPAPVTERPLTTENTNGRGSNGGVVAAQ